MSFPTDRKPRIYSEETAKRMEKEREEEREKRWQREKAQMDEAYRKADRRRQLGI